MSDKARIYVADLAAYNEGKGIGQWFDLDDYSDTDELSEAISEKMKQWSKEQGVEREEYAIHDTEGLPSSLSEEYMSASDFKPYYEAKEVADDMGVPVQVVLDWMNDRGVDDPTSAREAYQGKYDDMEDFAYRMVEDGVITDTSDYISMTETDRRIMAGEEADNIVDNTDDDDLIREADMEKELQDLESKRDEEEENEESEFDFDDEKENLVDKAKDKVRDEKYDEIYEALIDPVQYLVEEQGLYSKEDLAKQSFITVDYEALARDLSHDYDEVSHDGDTYIFSSNYSTGGTIEVKKETGGPADDGSIKVGDKVQLNESVITERLTTHTNKNLSSYRSLKKLQKLIGQTGEVYDAGKNLIAVEFPGQNITVIKEYLQKIGTMQDGGKPIGSTGLFAKGGQMYAALVGDEVEKITDNDIIYKIHKYSESEEKFAVSVQKHDHAAVFINKIFDTKDKAKTKVKLLMKKNRKS